ncbi:MAG: hypothetical protein QM737_12655 [Ferruginibacter sp.]
METIVVSHKVGNIDAWLKGHKERQEIFAPAVSGFKTFVDANDSHSVSLVIDVIDMEKLGAIINDPKNDALKAKHTVLDPIRISMAAEL